MRLERLAADPHELSASKPLVSLTAEGKLRHVGVEIEFTGLELAEAARIAAAQLPAQLEFSHDYEAELVCEALGKFRLEVDNQYLKQLGRRRADDESLGLIDSGAEALLASAVGSLTPIELISPPIAPAFLTTLDALVEALARHGAVGTQKGLLSAFGVHFNPELTALDPETIWRHVTAYVVLEDWLSASLAVDLSRRVSGFVQSYSTEFAANVLDEPAPSTVPDLIDRYLQFNPSRNRSLDLLPLLAHLDRARVERLLDDDAGSSRPTFHFRLPNSLVGAQDWSVTRGWRHWLVIEDLACDSARLSRAIDVAKRNGRNGRLGLEDAAACLA